MFLLHIKQLKFLNNFTNKWKSMQNGSQQLRKIHEKLSLGRPGAHFGSLWLPLAPFGSLQVFLQMSIGANRQVKGDSSGSTRCKRRGRGSAVAIQGHDARGGTAKCQLLPVLGTRWRQRSPTRWPAQPSATEDEKPCKSQGRAGISLCLFCGQPGALALGLESRTL